MKEDTFEKNMKELEEVVSSLENGNLSLEEAISKFEEGIKLSKKANEKLESAEKRINILLSSEDGAFKEEKFEIEE